MTSRLPRPLAVALAAVTLATGAQAAGEQACTAANLAPVDRWLAKHPWKLGSTGPEARVTASCKVSSSDTNLVIVAAQYTQGQEWDTNAIIALVDTRSRSVRAALQRVLFVDSGVGVNALRIDTARYDLAPRVRAFGIDQYQSAPHSAAADNYSGTQRTLVVQEGPVLRPVLEYYLDTSHHGQGSTWTIAIGRKASHGFADLVVTRTVDAARDGAPVVHERSVLHYDGVSYGDGNPGALEQVGPEPEPAVH